MSRAGKVAILTTDGRHDLTCKIWKKRPSPLHGTGLFALCDIQEGEVVLSELPVGDALQDPTHSIEKGTTKTSNTPGAPFPAYGDASTQKRYHHVHLFNHSCAPNAEAVINPETGRLVVRAVCEIEAAEEITIPYISLLSVRSVRWTELGFNCRCETCLETGHALRASDDLRKKLADHLALMRVFQARYFSPISDDLKVTMEAVRKIDEDNAAFGMMMSKIMDAGEAILVMDFRSSDLALIDDMGYAAMMVGVRLACDGRLKAKHLHAAFTHKLNMFQHVARSSGVEHPQSRRILSRLLRLINVVKGRYSFTADSMLREVQGVLTTYHWELQFELSEQGKEVVIEWDELWADSDKWNVVL